MPSVRHLLTFVAAAFAIIVVPGPSVLFIASSGMVLVAGRRWRQSVHPSEYPMWTMGVATTTVRVDTATHARLSELSELSGMTLIETIREAAGALRGQRFAHQVVAELADLAQNAAVWGDYLADANSSSVGDGVG